MEKPRRFAECHSDRPLYSRKMCKWCYTKDLERRNPGYHARKKAKKRKVWAEYYGEVSRGRRKALPPEERWSKDLQYKYGINLNQWMTLYLLQHGWCAICGGDLSARQIATDHDHKSGRIRGLLCKPCNSYLGWYERRSNHIHDYIKGGTWRSGSRKAGR